MRDRTVPKCSVRGVRPQNRLRPMARNAVMLLALVMVLLSSSICAQVLVDKSVTFPAIDLTWNTSPSQELVFDVEAPGFVTVKIWVDPYRGCYKVAYQSVSFQWEKERIPFEKRVADKPGLYAEGAPLYLETTYQAFRAFRGIHVWLNPARTLSPSSGWTQYRQVVRLVVEYSATPPAGVEVQVSEASKIDWSTRAEKWRGQNGQQVKVVCPAGGSISSRLWGTDTYTDDSSICTAAVHAGLITTARGGTVTIEIKSGTREYQASTRNGVTSKDYGSFSGGGFSIVSGGGGGQGSDSGGGGTSTGGGGGTGGSRATMTLRAESRKAKTGDTLTLPIWLEGASGVANMNFNVTYDSAVVRVSGVTKGSFFTGRTMVESNPGEKGVVRFGFADRADLSGTGPVAQINCQVIGKAGDRSPIRLQVSTASGAAGTKPVVKTVDGEIQVLGSTGGDLGDSNGNGMPDAGDALEALKMSVRLIAVKMVCDMDSDGQVTSTDARLILEKVVGR